MKALVSIAAPAVALALALAWPSVGEAQSKKAKARTATTASQQHYVRYAKVKRAAAAKPCAARTWAGCQGWDPDPNVRSMIQMDAGRDDQ
jgi:hypothetical protein